MSKKLSPHVTIYKFPITAISSIATRLSGVYLSGLFIGGGIIKLVNKEIMKNNLEYRRKMYYFCENNYYFIQFVLFYTQTDPL